MSKKLGLFPHHITRKYFFHCIKRDKSWGICSITPDFMVKIIKIIFFQEKIKKKLTQYHVILTVRDYLEIKSKSWVSPLVDVRGDYSHECQKRRKMYKK